MVGCGPADAGSNPAPRSSFSPVRKLFNVLTESHSMTSAFADLVYTGHIGSWGKPTPTNFYEGSVLVDWIAYGFSGSNNALRTKNLYTCMGIFLYDETTQVGFLAHVAHDEYINDFSSNSLVQEINQVLQKYLADSYKPQNFKGTIVGVSCPSGDANVVEHHNQKSLNYVRAMESRLRAIGFSMHDAERVGLVANAEITREAARDTKRGIVSIEGYDPYNYHYLDNKTPVEKITLNLLTGEVEQVQKRGESTQHL